MILWGCNEWSRAFWLPVVRVGFMAACSCITSSIYSAPLLSTAMHPSYTARESKVDIVENLICVP
jgi:hypothetical protein